MPAETSHGEISWDVCHSREKEMGKVLVASKCSKVMPLVGGDPGLIPHAQQCISNWPGCVFTDVQ